MTLEQLIVDLKDAGASSEIINMTISAYERGKADAKSEIATELYNMPLNDTAHSIAIWIKEQ